MDGSRFDRLTRTLTSAGSRRRALGGLLAGALGQLGSQRGEDAAAHDLKAKCKKKSGTAKKKCLKKAKKHAASHTSPPPAPPVDVCQGRNVCTEGNAAACGPAGNECYCWVTAEGAPLCGGNATAFGAANCNACAVAGRVCVQGGGTQCPASVVCVLPCSNRATCNDEIQNGDESDIDCGGGTCPRCGNAKTCTSRHNCATARCVLGICAECTSNTECGLDTDNSPCVCEDGYCIKTTTPAPSVASCAECPDDTVCLGAAGLFCYKLCGAP